MSFSTAQTESFKTLLASGLKDPVQTEATWVLLELASVFFNTSLPPRPELRGLARQDGQDGQGSSVDETLPSLEAIYRTLVEQIPAVIFMAHLDRGFGEAYVSPQIEALLGFSQEEWLNDPVRWYRQIHPDDKTRWNTEAAQMLLTGQPVRSVYRVIARNGQVIWFHCEVKMVRKQDGSPWFIHGIGFDISDSKRAEEALRASEGMLRGLFEHAPDSVVVADHDGRIQRINGQVREMFGYDSGELVGEPVEVLLPERFRAGHINHRADYHQNARIRPMGAELELYARRKDGSEFPVDIMLSPMEGLGGGMVIAVIRDITSRVRTAETIKRHEQELQALTINLLRIQDEERRRIARELHDSTAQNLAGLTMNLSRMISSTTPIDFGIRDVLNDTLNLAEQCAREVRNLSYLLHPPLLDDLGLGSALRSYINGFNHRTRMQVELDLPPDLQRLGPDLELAVFRIVQEALSNAHRHSGSPTADIRIAFAGPEIVLEVTDRGRGFAPKALGPERPPGVGLASMRERAQNLGGTMEARSTTTGTTIRVTFPLGAQYEASSHFDRG
ncbi:MAG TPA: PAS domain S-box protein [Blastocatellia bacterium]